MDLPRPQTLQNGQRLRRRAIRYWRPSDIVWAICVGLCIVLLFGYGWHLRALIAKLERSSCATGEASTTAASLPPYTSSPLLVSYAFYEKDVIQRTNMEFFLQHGWVAPPGGHRPVTWVFVVAGERCSPCKEAFPITTELEADPQLGVSRATRVLRSIDDPEDELEEADHDQEGVEPPGASTGLRIREGGGSTTAGQQGSGAGFPDASGRRDVAGPGPGPTLVLWRSENVGMDLASHNVSLEYVRRRAGGLSRYRYFLLLNSSVKGPFLPAYLPPWWHWTHAFLERFQPLPQDDPRWKRPPPLQVLPPGTPYRTIGRRPVGQAVVRAVGASLVCLPEADAGGPGPRLESWAVALDSEGMELVIQKGVFRIRGCKTCSDAEEGIIVGGEYGITAVLLEAGHNVATLMSKYARDVDWRDPRHWGCNDMVHPSRHGTYDGIGFHPYETVFVKSSWHVADPYTRRYSLWMTQHKEGDAGTDGEWNEKLYRYAISPEAQQPNLLEAAYNVEMVQHTLARQREAEARKVADEERAAGERAMALAM